MGYAPKGKKKLYLSFDDGPHPTITPFVLNELRKYNAKATFFCIGENVVKYPGVYRQLLEEGHAIGNHTQHHINGWKSADEIYLNDIKAATAFIDSPLYRPPYGRISRSQIRKLKQEGFKDQDWSIVMWNILAGDWVQELSPEKCYQRISGKIRAGDIIVFHDSEKAWDRMSYCLPLLLEKYSKEGFQFEKIG
ncbi:MAG: polysaccharide deacetylase family protein [Chitinophagaceae bacterium]|nr:polysaccharide deacetylase family protein [Chitinophagaceae bacterium]